MSCLSLSSWGNFGRPATPGKVYHSSQFSPFVDNGSDRGSLESQSLGNIFIHLSRMMHANYFVSHLFLNVFRSRHDALLFKHASLLLLLLIGFMAYCNHDLYKYLDNCKICFLCIDLPCILSHFLPIYPLVPLYLNLPQFLETTKSGYY